MKKVFLSLLVAAFFATFVVACGNKTDENADDVDTAAIQEMIDDAEEEIEEVDEALQTEEEGAETAEE
ncbi:MAG: hypothetical protein RQ866_02075 [Bacteroidales bacterium]|nr:hypothetical protein [Bacteroidales bacterium]